MSAFDLDVLARIQAATAEQVERGAMWSDPGAQAMYLGARLQAEATYLACVADRGQPIDEHLIRIAAIAIASLETVSSNIAAF